MKNLKCILTALVLSLVLFSVNGFSQKAEILAVSKKIVAVLKSKNASALANYVHPVKGLRFSPYSDFAEDSILFRKTQIAGLGGSRKIYEWGSYDGSGDPIKLSFAKYYAKFIFDRDYTKALQISYQEIAKGGNTLVDIEKVFPRGKYVDYHYPSGADGNEMGWSSLRLIFEKQANKWYLVGIGHGQWTI